MFSVIEQRKTGEADANDKVLAIPNPFNHFWC